MLVKILVILAPIAAWSHSSSNRHEVQSGETLSGILFDHGFRRLWCSGCAVEEVTKLNALSDPDLLQIGQILLIRREDIESVVEQAAVPKEPTPQEPTQESSPLAVEATDLPVQTESDVIRETANEEHLRSEIVLAVPLHFVAIEGVDRADQTHGKLLTNLSPGLLLGWRLNFTEDWQTEVAARVEKHEVQPDLNLTNIENREQTLSELELHVRYGSTVRLGLDLRTRERLVYRAATGLGIRVQTVPVSSVGLSAETTLLRISSATLQAKLGADSIVGSSQVETGLAMNGRLRLRQDFESWALEAEAGYENSMYKTTLVELTSGDLWLTWGIVWKL